MAASKTFASFLPAEAVGLEEAERHYTSVHVPLARRLLAQNEAITSYSLLRVRRELDANGGWEQRPTAWRFTTQTFDETAVVTAFDPSVRERLARDHLNCLYRLRRCEVEEEVVLDRLSGQVTFATYLIELDRSLDDDRDTAAADVRELLERLRAATADLGGIRRIVSNSILRETIAEPLREEGQRLIDLFRSETEKVAYVEVLADERWSGSALFAHPDVATWIVDARTRFAVAACYETELGCGFDRR